MKSKRIKLPNTVDHSPATSGQIQYIHSLNITIPKDATRSDAKALIDSYLDEDVNAPQNLIEYARSHEILCSSYVGYKFLHNLMFDNLSLLDLTSFFCYCIYQDLNEELHENLDTHKHSKVFYDFAILYEKDFYFITSLQEYYGDDLITFGKNTINFPDGSRRTVYGGSRQTLAYKTAYEYLKNNLNISLPDVLPSPKPSFLSRILKTKSRG